MEAIVAITDTISGLLIATFVIYTICWYRVKYQVIEHTYKQLVIFSCVLLLEIFVIALSDENALSHEYSWMWCITALQMELILCMS